MTTYCVRKTGSDSNAGTSPAAAWLTITHALLAASGLVAGDILQIGAGTYRELPQVKVSGAVKGTAITAVSAAVNPTITTSAAHGLSVGQTIRIVGVVGSEEINGLWTVASVPSGTTFTITLPVAPSTWVSGGVVSLPIVIRGDNDGSVTGDVGEVIVTGWTTSDTAAQSSTRCTFDCSAQSDLLIQNLTIMGSQASGALCVDSNWSWGVGGLRVTFQNCLLNALSSQSSIGRDIARLFAPADTGMAWWFNRCLFVGAAGANFAVNARGQNSPTADYDIGVVCTNCLFVGSNGGAGVVYAAANGVSGGSGTFRPGGVLLDRCSVLLIGGLNPSSGCSRLIPAFAINSNLLPGQAATVFSSGGAVFFTIAEDCNYLAVYDGVAYASVFAGAQTLANDLDAPLLNLGEAAMIGGQLRPFLEPKPGFPLLRSGTYSQQTKPPTVAADDAGIGTIAWTNPSNALLPDAVYAVATAIPAVSGISHYLDLTGFGFQIPSNATVTGVVVELVTTSSGGTPSFDSVKLIKGGVVGGTDRASTMILDAGNGTNNQVLNNGAWPGAVRQFRNGSPTDLWGNTLAPSDVNASNFGVAIAVKNTHATATATADIDFVRLTVFYQQAINTVLTDLFGRPRPTSVALDTPGALVRGNVAVVNTSVQDGSHDSLQLFGPGNHDLSIPVDAVATVISIKCQYDSNYGGTLLPQMQIINGGECGVADQTVTATSSALNVWEVETFASFTPTKQGIVTLRLINRSSTANGNAYFSSPSY